MSRHPDLPQPEHLSHDSMLSRVFGREVTNYFSSSPLNRLSFLRDDYSFLKQAFDHRTTRFLLFQHLSPLVKSFNEINYVSRSEIQPVVPHNPYERTEQELIDQYDSSIRTPQLVFLGIDERQADGLRYKNFAGSPYFALDVTPRPPYEEGADGVIAAVEKQGLRFLKGIRIMDFPAETAATYAISRALLDWNARNPFCATCGQPTLSINAGAKRICPPTDLARSRSATTTIDRGENDLRIKRPPCSSRTSRSNLAFPRTDPTIIVAVLSHDRQRVLLGRQRSWPPKRFSTLAGFVEPAESVEDAVRREVWEESGVLLSRVVIHSTQPWPYPANLMIGAIAQVVDEAHEQIQLNNDPELESAQWFTLQEIKESLAAGTTDFGNPTTITPTESSLKLPPPTAIAHQLINAVVHDDFLAGMLSAKI